jgi:DNA-binding PadR family transcriptional regulator
VSATRLLVLGVVRMYGKAHGYQVRRELLSWSADKWANVAPGSIYHALKKMAAEGLLEEVTTDGEARGPDRTAYQLTPDGQTEFQRLLERGLAESEENVQGTYRFAAAMTFLTALPRAPAISLLRHRLTQLTGQHANARFMLERGSGWGEPAHVHELYRLWVTNVEGMIGWLEELLRRLESGRYVMADDEGTSFGAPGSAQTNQT